MSWAEDECFDGYEFDYCPQVAPCKVCGQMCEWGEHEGKWRLFEMNGSRLHTCNIDTRIYFEPLD